MIKVMCEKENELRTMKSNILILENDKQLFEKIERGAIIESKKDGKTYSLNIREASYHLQNFGISQKNVSNAIKLVHKTCLLLGLGDSV